MLTAPAWARRQRSRCAASWTLLARIDRISGVDAWVLDRLRAWVAAHPDAAS